MHDSADRIDARTPSPVVWIAGVQFLIVMGFGLVPPALPVLARHYTLSTSQAALMLTAFAFGRLAFSLPGGLIADRLGFKRVAVTGCVVTGIGALFAALLPSFWALIAAQMIQGLGSSLYTTAALAAILSEAPEHRVGRVTALYQGVVLIGMSAAPAIGGMAVSQFGLSGPFLVYAVGAFLAFAITMWRLPAAGPVARNTDDSEPESTPRRMLLAEMFRHRAVTLALLVSFLTFWVIAGVRNTLIPVFAELAFGLGPVGSGWLLTAAAMANVAVLRHAGRVIDRGRRPVMIYSTFGMAAAVGALALAISPWVLLFATLMIGVTKGYAAVVPITVIVDVADRKIQAAAIGFQRTATGLGLTIGPFTAGLLADELGYTTTFLISGALLAIVAAAAIRSPETQLAPTSRGR